MTDQLARGARGPRVKEMQEWLNLHGSGCAIDGDFGPATEAALRHFQAGCDIIPPDEHGRCNGLTWSFLRAPLQRAEARCREADPALSSFGEAVVLYAMQHLDEHPREVGGQNRGPWVRYYTGGRDGDVWAWCAGFATSIVRQACAHHNTPLPIRQTLSCDVLALDAAERGRLARQASAPAREAEADAHALTAPGDLFLVHRHGEDWTHTGVVTEVVGPGLVRTIEGNTNDDGSREGYEVCARTRRIDRLDFIHTGPQQGPGGSALA